MTEDLLDFGDDAGRRPCLDATAVLSDIPKVVIRIEFDNQCHTVSWFSDTCATDIQAAILATCTALVGESFVLRETGGTKRCFDPSDFHKLENHGVYSLVALASIGNDGNLDQKTNSWRRLTVSVDPKKHVELARAIARMLSGSNLLKHSRSGVPQMRFFQLSPDLKVLNWSGGRSSVAERSIPISKIKYVSIGQVSEGFRSYPLPALAHLSFSIAFQTDEGLRDTSETRSLPVPRVIDLTAKDEDEFDYWVAGVKGLWACHTGNKLSKQSLLGHSRRFRNAVLKKNANISFTQLQPESTVPSLKTKIVLSRLTLEDAECRVCELRERLEGLMTEHVGVVSQHLENSDQNSARRLNASDRFGSSWFASDDGDSDSDMEDHRSSLVTSKGTLSPKVEYRQVAASESAAAENDLESTQFHQLSTKCLTELDSLSAILEEVNRGSRTGKAREQALRDLEYRIWTVEVDVENCSDILERIVNGSDSTWATSWQNVWSQFSTEVTHEVSRMTSFMSDAMDSVLQMSHSLVKRVDR